MKPFLRFVGTILRNQIAEIPGQPRFLCENGPKMVLKWEPLARNLKKF